MSTEKKSKESKRDAALRAVDTVFQAGEAMKRPHVLAELVRDRHGRVVDIVACPLGEFQPVMELDNPGFLQVINGEGVAFLKPNELLVLKVRGGF